MVWKIDIFFEWFLLIVDLGIVLEKRSISRIYSKSLQDIETKLKQKRQQFIVIEVVNQKQKNHAYDT